MDIDNIYLGDCLELMKEIPDASVDCIICDLPYSETGNKWDVLIDSEKLFPNTDVLSKMMVLLCCLAHSV